MIERAANSPLGRAIASNLGLYACAVLIWGSTWLVIKFQLGSVAPAVSVAWRFGAAALVLFALSLYRGVPLGFDARTHAWLALQGLLLYSAGYVLIYLSELSLPSGMVAVTFSLVILCNIGFQRIFFGVPMKPHILAGGCLGIAGVALLFWPDLTRLSLSADRRLGLLFCVLSTVIASLGNMAAMRNHRHGIPVVAGNAWAMLYGSLFVAAYVALSGQRFSFDPSLRYVASLLYLALFGSVIAFVAYLTLLGRIGVDRAGYSGVATPMVAMGLSTWFESLQWDAWIFGGMSLCLAGNLMVLGKDRGIGRA
jgi:drug/metabolite transporter (DMT)-like permease